MASLGRVKFMLTSSTDWGSNVKTLQSGAGTSLGKPDYIERRESVTDEFIREDTYLFFAVTLAETETVGSVASGMAGDTFGWVQFEDNAEFYGISKATLYNAGNLVYIQGLVSGVIP